MIDAAELADAFARNIRVIKMQTSGLIRRQPAPADRSR